MVLGWPIAASGSQGNQVQDQDSQDQDSYTQAICVASSMVEVKREDLAEAPAAVRDSTVD